MISHFQKISYKKAFTLAEVLITLAIIGVIAAISVPSLIQKTNQAELKTAWKKDFAMISQAADTIAYETGSFKGICATATDLNCIRDYFSNYLKVVKKCDINTSQDNCWSRHKFMNGTDDYSTYGAKSSMILNSGAFVLFYANSSTCTSNLSNAGNACTTIVVDVNGFKNPNVIGKDIFALNVYDDGTFPYGSGDPHANDYSPGHVQSDNTKYGYGLSAIYLYDK